MMTNTGRIDTQHSLTRQIHITTFNINGIHKKNKKMDTFELIRNRNIDNSLTSIKTLYT